MSSCTTMLAIKKIIYCADMNAGYGGVIDEMTYPDKPRKQGLNSALVMEAFSPSFFRTVRLSLSR